MNRNWIRWRPDLSWHVIGKVDATGWRTVCGRPAPDDSAVSDELPAGRSCELCLRSIARQDDKVGTWTPAEVDVP